MFVLKKFEFTDKIEKRTTFGTNIDEMFRVKFSNPRTTRFILDISIKRLNKCLGCEPLYLSNRFKFTILVTLKKKRLKCRRRDGFFDEILLKILSMFVYSNRNYIRMVLLRKNFKSFKRLVFISKTIFYF